MEGKFMKEYVQKVVWIGTVLGDASTEEFEQYFQDELGYRVRYDGEFRMVGGHYEGLNCIVFSIHSEDISRFAVFRIRAWDMKWLEDFYENEGVNNFPVEFLEEYREYFN